MIFSWSYMCSVFSVFVSSMKAQPDQYCKTVRPSKFMPVYCTSGCRLYYPLSIAASGTSQGHNGCMQGKTSGQNDDCMSLTSSSSYPNSQCTKSLVLSQNNLLIAYHAELRQKSREHRNVGESSKQINHLDKVRFFWGKGGVRRLVL